MTDAVIVTGGSLTLDEVVRVAREGASARIDDATRERIAAGHATLQRSLDAGAAVYGGNTGVGAAKLDVVAADEEARFNRVMMANHRVGSGPDAPDDLVRATLLRVANHLASGRNGVRPELVEALLAALDRPTMPRMRMLGSLGLGDIAPLVDLALEAVPDFELGPSEGLALYDHNAFGTASAALAIADCERLADALDATIALDLEGFGANFGAIDPIIATSRPYPGLAATRQRVADLVVGSDFEDRSRARNLQDPTSFRSAVQTQGAFRDVLARAREVLDVELNAFQGNPIVIAEEDRVQSVGQFQVLPLALAVDALRQALAAALTIQVERTIKQLSLPYNGLSRGLRAHAHGGEPGLEILSHGMVSLVAECRHLAAPVATKFVSSSIEEGIEDLMTFLPMGARKLGEMCALGERVVAAALIVSAQACDLRGHRLGAGTQRLHDLVRTVAPALEPNGVMPLLDPVEALVHAGDVGRI
ncbi:MAG: aromatic amino acid lyase [Gaiellales bacterium]